MKIFKHALFFAAIVIFSSGFFSSEKANDRACWGQATAVFAQMGAMGEHASQQPTPREGLRNLARALYETGVLPDDSMEALGAFVAAELGLSIEACD